MVMPAVTSGLILAGKIPYAGLRDRPPECGYAAAAHALLDAIKEARAEENV